MSLHRRTGTSGGSISYPSTSLPSPPLSPFPAKLNSGSPSTRQVRRLLVLPVLFLVFGIAYTQRLHEYLEHPRDIGKAWSALSYSRNLGQESISKQLGQAEHAGSAPFSHGLFELASPSYEVLVLRSSIQHQNDTWRGTNTRNGKDWLIQTLAWLKVNNGVRPELDAVSAWCKLPSPSSHSGHASEYALTDTNKDTAKNSIKAQAELMWTHHGDRGIGQDTLIWLECDATPLLRAHYKLPKAPSSSFTADQVAGLDTISLDFAFEHKLSAKGEGLKTSTSGPVHNLSLWYTASEIATPVHRPLEKVKMTACLSPAFYRGHKMPLLKWLEWREHMRHIGTERVAWYGREEEMRAFVDSYNRLAGTKDVFRYAPPLGDHGESYYNDSYHDQDAWYNDCILAHRLSTDFLFILDVDEFPMLDFNRLPSTSLADQWSQFLEKMPQDRGWYEMSRIPMSTVKGHGMPDTSKLVQDEYVCVHYWDKHVKSFYRANTLLTANQHKKTRSYPIGKEIAQKIKAKPDRPYWEVSWDSDKEGKWPKLFHYRWFSHPSASSCTKPSPLDGSEQYTQYLDGLRSDVFALKDKIEAELGITGEQA